MIDSYHLNHAQLITIVQWDVTVLNVRLLLCIDEAERAKAGLAFKEAVVVSHVAQNKQDQHAADETGKLYQDAYSAASSAVAAAIRCFYDEFLRVWYAHVCMHACICVCTYACMHVRPCMHVYVYVRMHVCMYVCTNS